MGDLRATGRCVAVRCPACRQWNQPVRPVLLVTRDALYGVPSMILQLKVPNYAEKTEWVVLA
jgi:hypothetical protein